MPEPMRMCAGCRERAPKKQLIRVVRTPAGEIVLDAAEKIPGRGTYICRRSECLKKVRKSHAFDRSLGVEIPAEVYERLIAELDGADG